MKRLMIAFFTATFFFACDDNDKSSSETSSADKEARPGDWVPVDSATAMRKMMEAGTPGQQHKLLAKADGKWTAETTMWMSPGARPIKSKSIAINKMILGGRYQKTTFKGNFMGMPYEGTSTTGYDNIKKVFFTSWMDNMSTMLMNMDGTWDDATRTINFRGKMICPGNGKECEMRERYQMVDDNHHVMEMYGPDMQTGKEYKNMEIKFTRGT
jgi:hypothetical protein